MLKVGHWPECADLPELFRRSARPGGIVLDVGANIGACSLHMLLSTEAHLIAFEPGAANRFFLSSSLLRMAQRWPQLHRRLLLYPLAAGASNSSNVLNAAVGNAGHAVVGQRPSRYAPKGHEPPQSILVRTLDDILWPRGQRHRPPPEIALVKLDVEGYECRALQGMRRLLAAGAIRIIKTEVFEYGLREQGCSGVELQRVLHNAGFRLYLAPPAPGVAPMSPEVLHDAALPYNLYCFAESLVSARGSSRSMAPSGSRPYGWRVGGSFESRKQARKQRV